MAGSNLRKFKNPEVLRKFSFPRLLEMISRYKGYFDRMNFPTTGNITEDTFDYDGLATILSNQMFVGEYEELFNGFALVGATSMECQRCLKDIYFQKQLCQRINRYHVNCGYGTSGISS